MAAWQEVCRVGKVHVLFAASLLLLTVARGAGGVPAKLKGPLAAYSKYLKPVTPPEESPPAEHPFLMWFDDVNAPQPDSVLLDDEQPQPEEEPITLWFTPFTRTQDKKPQAPALQISPTKVFTQPPSSDPPQTIRPSITTATPITVTVTATSTVFVPSIVHSQPVTSTVFITVLPQEVVGSMDAFFRSMSTMTAAIRSIKSSVPKEDRDLMEKVVRLSRPSLVIDSLRMMPAHQRKLLIVHMEKLMDEVSKTADTRYKQDPSSLKTTLVQLSNHMEGLNPLVYRK